MGLLACVSAPSKQMGLLVVIACAAQKSHVSKLDLQAALHVDCSILTRMAF